MNEQTVYLSLGSNMGNRHDMLTKAIEHIAKLIGTVVRQSAFIETEPWGFVSENRFLNAAVCVMTNLTPMELLQKTQEIERRMGRTQKSIGHQYHDRPIDIDILLYGDLRLSTPLLTIPHPLMTQRDFVLQPLKLIMPATEFAQLTPANEKNGEQTNRGCK